MTVCADHLGGESYSALAEGGLQAKLTLACGSLLERRTGSLSAAYKNLEEQMFTQSFEALCAHYQLCATRNNKGISHENGASEYAHWSFKHRLDQALKLRGSTEVATIKAYQTFL